MCKGPAGVRTVPLHDLFADGRGAGEAQLSDVWVLRQTLSHHPACARARSYDQEQTSPISSDSPFEGAHLGILLRANVCYLIPAEC